ncbi:hypothetical protein [Nonomuraea longicatena]
MSTLYSQQSEEEQLSRLGLVQEGLASVGIRSLLVRRLRLRLVRGRFHPPEPDGPTLVAGGVTVSVSDGYVVRGPDAVAVFSGADDAVAYTGLLLR